VKPALLKMSKGELNALRNSSCISSLPKILCRNDTRAVMICFGCKTAKAFQPQYHLRSECKHAEEHLTTLKALLGDSEEGNAAEGGDPIILQRLLATSEKKLKEKSNLLNSLEEDHGKALDFILKLFGKDFDSVMTEMQEREFEDPKSYYASLDVGRCSMSHNSKKELELYKPEELFENPIDTTPSYIPTAPRAIEAAPVSVHPVPKSNPAPVELPPATSTESIPAPSAPRPKMMPKMAPPRPLAVIQSPPVAPLQYDAYGNPMPRIITSTKRVIKIVPPRPVAVVAPVALRTFEELQAVDMNALTEGEMEQWYTEMAVALAARKSVAE